ncbi:MAG: hypothetical protein D3914_06520 [Candidatus Electrothrix sp. LOE2]|nr:hypothetical protein [Candidatus Electrothrix sp. LOE2]
MLTSSIVKNSFPLLLILAFSMPTNSYSKICKKGKPCGNTCIAKYKECHVGVSSGYSPAGSPSYSSFSTSNRSSSLSMNMISPKLLNVIDGDTIIISFLKRERKVRLYGIDSPELSQHYGDQAKEALSGLLSGNDLEITIYDKDKYGRDIGTVIANGSNINEILIRKGFAWVYNKYCRKSFCDGWRIIEQEAKKAKKGLWKNPDPKPPWEWRKSN